MADMGILRFGHFAPPPSISTCRLVAGTIPSPPVSLRLPVVLPNSPLRKTNTAGPPRLRHVFRPQSAAADDQTFWLDPADGPVTDENKCMLYYKNMFRFENGLAATYCSLSGLSGPRQDNMDMISKEFTLFCEEKEKIEQYTLEIASNLHSIRGDLLLSNGRKLALALSRC